MEKGIEDFNQPITEHTPTLIRGQRVIEGYMSDNPENYDTIWHYINTGPYLLRLFRIWKLFRRR